MPDVKTSITPDGLPCVAWTDNEYHPENFISPILAVSGLGLGLLLGWMTGRTVVLWGLGGIALGFVLGSFVHHEWFRTRTRRRRCIMMRDGKDIVLASQPDVRSSHRNTMPFAELQGFELASASEWFDRGDDAGKERPSGVLDPYVLFAQRTNGNHMLIASHVGSRDEMAKLHAKLTEQFIESPESYRNRTAVKK